MDSLKDYLGEEFFVGDTIAVATHNGIRVGPVLKFNKTENSDGTTKIYGVQIHREVSPGEFRKQSFQYYRSGFFKVESRPRQVVRRGVCTCGEVNKENPLGHADGCRYFADSVWA